jgi:DNA-binding CsgD family transcriptional regulator
MMPAKSRAKTKKAAKALPGAAEIGVALLNLAFHPIAMDEGAASILSATWADANGGPPSPEIASGLPPVILEHLRQSGPGGASPTEVRFNVRNRLYVGRAYLVETHDGTLHRDCVVLHLERESDISDACLEVSLKYRLTDREREALRGVANGLTSKELAERMNISPSTVKTFLRLIMIKTGAPNRAGIVAKLLAPTLNADPAEEKAARQSDGEWM